MTEQQYKTFAQGLLIVRAKNSSFNSDFSGLPRRLPDNLGTIYATDKALKYCIRKYLHDKGEKLFVWRRSDRDTGLPYNIDKNYNSLFGDFPMMSIKKEGKKTEDIDKNKILTNILECIDSRLFGFTYTGKTNISVTGPIQLSYGINKITENQFYSNQILSPYQNYNKKEDKQQTLGNETKTLESHYVYDFTINPNNLINSLESVDKKQKETKYLQKSDVEEFKESMCRGVSSVTSSSKIGSDSELFLFIEMNSDEKDGLIQSNILPLMKDLVNIDSKDGKTVIDLSAVSNNLTKNYTKYINNVEMYYDDSITSVVGMNGLPVTKKHIVTLDDIDD